MLKVTQTEFGEINGQKANLFTIKNETGFTVTCTNYGCIITKILMEDRDGKVENVVLGFDSTEEYQCYSQYFGAVIGRVAGRIKDGRFELGGKNYQISQNDGHHHMHGGDYGFQDVLWDSKIIYRGDGAGVEFSYTSIDGEQGYPGNVKMKTTYLVNHQNQLIVSYEGISDKKTLLNVTNHSYFNLSGNLKRDVLNHILTIKSDRFFELDEELLPTGNLLGVEKTPFDFRKGRKIRDGVRSTHPQNLLVGKGYDHPFLLNKNHQQEMVLRDEESGRQLIVETDEPVVVFYSGGHLRDDFQIRGTRVRKYLGACLETQKPPDSVHHPYFHSMVLEKGKLYHSTTTYTFMVK
jgi:aldose 1-epimerase